MFMRIRSWIGILAVVFIGGQGLGMAADAKASPKLTAEQQRKARADADHRRDNRLTPKDIGRPTTYYRYTTKKQAEKDMRNGLPWHTHMTAPAKAGRPLSPANAKKAYVLDRKPTVRETIVMPKGQPIRKAQVIGSPSKRVETSSTKKAPPGVVTKVTLLKQTKKK